MNNLDFLYKNRLLEENSFFSNKSDNDLDTDSDSDEEIPIVKAKNITKQSYIVISSINRDWFNLSPNTFKYSISISPVSNTSEEHSNMFINDNGAFILNKFKNIKSFSVSDVIVPNIPINIEDRVATRYLSNRHDNTSSYSGFSTLKDLPHLLIKVKEIDGIWDSTCNDINQSIGVMVPIGDLRDIINHGDDRRETNIVNSISRESNSRKYIQYKNIENWKKTYYPTLKNGINKLNIEILDNNGNTLNLLNDFLDINYISIVTNTISSNIEINKIKIITNKYFSYYEYQEGDTLVFNNFKFNQSKEISKFNISELEKYINRKTGHIIREVSTPNNNIKLSNELYINFPHKLDLDTGTIVVDNNYIGSIPSDDILYNNTSKDLGKIVNKNLQNIIVFNIETVTHDASILGTDLI